MMLDVHKSLAEQRTVPVALQLPMLVLLEPDEVSATKAYASRWASSSKPVSRCRPGNVDMSAPR